MAAVFLGELFRFTWIRRLLLLLAGVAAALMTNVGRTFFLSWSAARDGIASVEKWHDPAGVMIQIVCFVLVWAIALLLVRQSLHLAASPSVLPARLPALTLSCGLSAWIVAILVAAEIWFYDGGKRVENLWDLLPPAGSNPLEISRSAILQLQCDHSSASAWDDADGSRWLLYSFEWFPGPVRSRILAHVHRPEVCLSSIGLKLTKDRGDVSVVAGGFKLVFRAYSFEQDGQPLYVYYGIWQSRSPRAQENGYLSASEHIAGVQAVLWRERNLGLQVVELAVSGYQDANKADEGFRTMMKNLLVRRPVSNLDN